MGDFSSTHLPRVIVSSNRLCTASHYIPSRPIFDSLNITRSPTNDGLFIKIAYMSSVYVEVLWHRLQVLASHR